VTPTSTGRFVRIVVVLNGLFYAAIGVLLLAAPEWFFANIGNFPPFNRHYLGDLGTFQVALGAMLLGALRRPAWSAALLGVAAAGGTLHALNHAYDAWHGAGGWDQTLFLAIFAAVTLAGFMYALRREPLQVAREQRRLANIGHPDQASDPALQAESKTAMRRHPMSECL